MFGGYKFGDIAPYIIVVVGITLVALFAWTIPFSKGYQAADKDHESDYAAHYTAEREYEECRSKASVEEAVRCAQNAAQTSRNYQRAEQDLDAQREMANWAEGILWATLILGSASLVITSIGVVYVALTLRETRNTTKAAVDGAKAAHNAAIATREVGEAQVRPWLLNVTIQTTMAGPSIIAGVERAIVMMLTPVWQNYGQSPATEVSVFADSILVESGNSFDDHPMTHRKGVHIVPPSEPIFGDPWPLHSDMLDRFIAREIDVIFFCRADYSDTFGHGNRYHTECMYRCSYNGEVIDNNGKRHPNITVAPEGQQNKAT